MLLYHCETCGRWQDVKLLEHLSTSVDKFLRSMDIPTEDRPEGYACPGGHGFMTLVQPTDRIMLRPEQQPDEPSNGRLVLLKSDLEEESELPHDG